MYFEVFTETPLFLTGAFLFGLLIGSFLNVVIARVPGRLEHDWKCQCRDLLGLESPDEPKPPGLLFPPSTCPNCGHLIRSWENIPVFSYLFLRGRCSGCRSRISPRYPIVEILTALLFLVSAWVFGPSAQFLACLVFSAVLVALSGIDLDHQLLPDSITYCLLWLGLTLSLFDVFVDTRSSLLGALAGYLTLWVVFHVFRLLTGKEGMGYGDFKLLAALGAWTGWQLLPLIVVLSAMAGAIVGIALLVTKKSERGQPIPYGPFLAAAGWITLLFGDRLLHEYLLLSGLAVG